MAIFAQRGTRGTGRRLAPATSPARLSKSNPVRLPVAHDRTWLFFAITLASTGALHGAIAAFGLPFSLSLDSPALALYCAGLAVPAVAAIILTETGHRVAFVRSALRLRSGAAVWTGIVFAQAAIFGISGALASAFDRAPGFRFEPSVTFGVLTLGQIWVAFGEELGWRGYALPRLIDRFGPAAATILLAAMWALWHAPMFFVANSLQASASPPVFAASILCWSAIHTLIYRQARPSALPNMAFHACANLTLNLFVFSPAITPFLIATYAIVAAIILAWLVARQLLAVDGVPII